jgi:hypothetical protein
MSRSTRLALAVAAALLALPAGQAVARTQIWNIEAARGEYTMTTKATYPVSCGTDEEHHRSRQVLGGRYHVAFSQVPGTRPTPIEYRNFLRGPGTWGVGSGMRYHVSADAHEDFRHIDTGDFESPCVQRDDSCELPPKRSKGRSWIGVTTRRGRVRVGLYIIGDTRLTKGCHDDDANGPEPRYSDDSGKFTPSITTTVPLEQFHKRVLTVRFKGSRRIHRRGYNSFMAFEGRLTWDASVRLRKSVFSKPCAERGRPTGFVCTK